jgi:toxin FitB
VSYLLDTNVVSEVRRSTPNPAVVTWLAGLPPGVAFVSVLTLGEIRRGIERLRRRDADQAHHLEVWLSRLESDYGDRLLPVTARIAQEWGRLMVPDPLPTIDGLLAATARVHGLTLVTRNIHSVHYRHKRAQRQRL